MAARLGARVGLLGCVGSDERGDELIARVAAEGVATWQVLSHNVREPCGPPSAQPFW